MLDEEHRHVLDYKIRKEKYFVKCIHTVKLVYQIRYERRRKEKMEMTLFMKTQPPEDIVYYCYILLFKIWSFN